MGSPAPIHEQGGLGPSEDDDDKSQTESHGVVMERAAEVMTGFRAGDWNKDVAVVRANYLLTDGAQQPGIPKRHQSGDPA